MDVATMVNLRTLWDVTTVPGRCKATEATTTKVHFASHWRE